jgi:hypothetical protein
MSPTALRQAAFGARRIYTVGSAADRKRTEKGGPDAQAELVRPDTRSEEALEPHWQAAIDSATD